MHFNSLLNLIGLSGKAHQGSPASGRVSDTRMPDLGAPFQVVRKHNFSRYIPLSALDGGRSYYAPTETFLPHRRQLFDVLNAWNCIQ